LINNTKTNNSTATKKVDESILDLINSKIILSLTDNILTTKNITTDTSISYKDNIVTVKGANETFSTKVNSDDTSKEGLLKEKEVITVKKQVSQVTDLIAKTKNKEEDIIYKGEHFTVQIYNNSNQQETEKKQKEKGLSVISFDKCSTDLKKYYNFTDDVIIGKIDWDPKMESKRNFGDVSLKYYNPYTLEELPAKEICKDKSVTIKYPTVAKIDKEEYDKYINQSFNIYDSNSSFYTDICTPLKNTTSDGDININRRIESIYKNLSLSCGSNCLFAEIDKDNYTVCNCVNFDESKAFIDKVVFAPFANLGIIKCFDAVKQVRNKF